MAANRRAGVLNLSKMWPTSGSEVILNCLHLENALVWFRKVKLRCSSKPADPLALSKRTSPSRDSRLPGTSKFSASWLQENQGHWGLMCGEGKHSGASSCNSEGWGAGRQLAVGCIIELPARFVSWPILEARLSHHSQDQFPHLCFRRNQSISDRSSTSEV